MRPEWICGALAWSVLIDLAAFVSEENAVVILFFLEADHLESTHVDNPAESVDELLSLQTETISHGHDIFFAEKNITRLTAAAITAPLTFKCKSFIVEAAAHNKPMKPV